MSQAVDSASKDATGVRQYLLAAYYLIAGNLSLSVIGLGAVMIVAGLVLNEPTVGDHIGNSAVFAGMLGIWGASWVVLGAVAYAGLWANKTYAKMS